MFEVFPHTADVGLRIQVNGLNCLFEEAGRGLLSLLVSNPESVQAKVRKEISIPGEDLEYLLFDWLNELLFLFETQHLLFSRFEVRLKQTGLQGMASGEAVDPTRHRLEHEVKAITYHGLSVTHEQGRWTAELILDI